MSTLNVFSGMDRGPKKPNARPLQHLRKMNPILYAALKLDQLDFGQLRVLAQCLERVPLPDRIEDPAVVAALADPELDFLKDYEETDVAFRGRWHALLALLGIDMQVQERHVEVKRRLGFVQRVLSHV